jgi:hypothetical protein
LFFKFINYFINNINYNNIYDIDDYIKNFQGWLQHMIIFFISMLW